MDEQTKELRERVAKLEEKVGKYESWLKALAIVAVIFGIAVPSWGYYFYQKAVDLTNKYGEVTGKYGEIKKQADGIEKDLSTKAENVLRSEAPKIIGAQMGNYAQVTELANYAKVTYVDNKISSHSHPYSHPETKAEEIPVSINVAQQNPASRPILIVGYCGSGESDREVEAKIGISPSELRVVSSATGFRNPAAGATPRINFTIIVPPGMYYEVRETKKGSSCSVRAWRL